MISGDIISHIFPEGVTFLITSGLFVLSIQKLSSLAFKETIQS